MRQNPTAKIRFELFVHKVWQRVPQVVFDLLLERQPIALDQFVEGGFFWFVALVVIGFGIGNRHRQAACLQQPWPFRIALPTSALVVSSGTPPWLGDSVQRVQIGEPFSPWLNPCSGRLAECDRPLPSIHYVLGHSDEKTLNRLSTKINGL